MSEVSEWEKTDIENTRLDGLALSAPYGAYWQKIMGALKRKFDEMDVDFQKLSGALVKRGDKATKSELPASGNSIGDYWTVAADGSEWAWNGTEWYQLGGKDADKLEIMVSKETETGTERWFGAPGEALNAGHPLTLTTMLDIMVYNGLRAFAQYSPASVAGNSPTRTLQIRLGVDEAGLPGISAAFTVIFQALISANMLALQDVPAPWADRVQEILAGGE